MLEDMIEEEMKPGHNQHFLENDGNISTLTPISICAICPAPIQENASAMTTYHPMLDS